LGLDIKVLDVDEKEIDLKQTFDEEDDVGIVNADDFDYVADDAELEEAYTVGEVEGNDMFADGEEDDDDEIGDEDRDEFGDIDDEIEDED
jgi:DNA-directed RNA polymerase subunit beta